VVSADDDPDATSDGGVAYCKAWSRSRIRPGDGRPALRKERHSAFGVAKPQRRAVCSVVAAGWLIASAAWKRR
jgi:hypothetical protein